jgi:hypothetical protein
MDERVFDRRRLSHPQSFAIRAGVPCPTARQVHCCPLPDGCECPEPQWLRSYRRPQRVRAGNPSRPRALSGRNGIPSTLKFPDLIWPAVVLARFLCRFPFYAASRCAWIRNASPHPAFTELGCRTCRESFGGGPPPKTDGSHDCRATARQRCLIPPYDAFQKN